MTKFKWPQKAVVGYVILALGTVFAINGVRETQNDSIERGKVVRGIICSTLTQTDEQSIEQTPGFAKLFHIDPAVLNKLLQKQLETNKHYRDLLAPSTPGSACHHGITKLKTKKV